MQAGKQGTCGVISENKLHQNVVVGRSFFCLSDPFLTGLLGLLGNGDSSRARAFNDSALLFSFSCGGTPSAVLVGIFTDADLSRSSMTSSVLRRFSCNDELAFTTGGVVAVADPGPFAALDKHT